MSTMEDAIARMADVVIDGDSAAHTAYLMLVDQGMAPDYARDEVARVVLAVLWAVDGGLADAETATENILNPAFKRIAAGESAVDLFTDDWRGEPLKDEPNV